MLHHVLRRREKSAFASGLAVKRRQIGFEEIVRKKPVN
jgi:hypothetical protein